MVSRHHALLAASHTVARKHNRDEAFYFVWNQGRAGGQSEKRIGNACAAAGLQMVNGLQTGVASTRQGAPRWQG